jgi:hypothetical protein
MKQAGYALRNSKILFSFKAMMVRYSSAVSERFSISPPYQCCTSHSHFKQSNTIPGESVYKFFIKGKMKLSTTTLSPFGQG